MSARRTFVRLFVSVIETGPLPKPLTLIAVYVPPRSTTNPLLSQPNPSQSKSIQSNPIQSNVQRFPYSPLPIAHCPFTYSICPSYAPTAQQRDHAIRLIRLVA